MSARDKLFGVSIVATVFLGACTQDAAPTKTMTSAMPSASNLPRDAEPIEVRPTLTRKSTPTDKRKADETACNGGDADACSRMADRFRAYGHPSGCGLERKGYTRTVTFTHVSAMNLRIKRMSEDWEADEEGFAAWIEKACDLGQTEICKRDRGPYTSFRAVRDKPAADLALRSSPDTSALLSWKKAKNPKAYAELLELRQSCPQHPYSCPEEVGKLYRRDVAKPPTELDVATRELAETILTKTLDARAILMMLDKNGYTAEMVTPVRAHAAKVLVEACVEGSCVCGDAAHFVADDDTRRLDLARLGCENGEAEGCYELGRLYEEGRGVSKDERAARMLYELACPPYRPVNDNDEPKTSEYSPAACDRLAAIYEGGVMPPKDVPRAQYYAEFACKDPGAEYDHAPCIRLGRYWTSRAVRFNCRGEMCPGDLVFAMEKFHGPRKPPFEGKECERPSVKELCDKYKGELDEMQKSPKP